MWTMVTLDGYFTHSTGQSDEKAPPRKSQRVLIFNSRDGGI